MSTLSGVTAKGEKGKSKYQSLDINSWFKTSKGESLETQQQKNTLQRRHGMQSLGKVPNTRRPPANLPSLKSEHSGNDPAVSLVPSGGTGWGSKPGEGSAPSTQSTTAITQTSQTASVSSVSTVTTVTSTSSSITPASAAAAAATSAVAASTPIIPPTIPTPTPHVDKSWSAIMSNSNETTPNFLAHQSPFFQQEFPSLSGAESTASTGQIKADSPHFGPGPSLRPQTEGSWMQGGSRPQVQMGGGAGNQQGTAPVPGPLSLPHLPPGVEVGGVRNNLGQSGGVGVQGGPLTQPPMPPHIRGVMPPFFVRGNFLGSFPSSNFQTPLHGPPRGNRFPYQPDGRFMQSGRPTIPQTTSNADSEDSVPRPIIKEEDLNRMDDIARDVGWATHDDIDYNQKLAFSDEEGGQDEDSPRKTNSKNLSQLQQSQAQESEKHSGRDVESSEHEDKSQRENIRDKTSIHAPPTSEPSRGWQPRPADFRGRASSSIPPQINYPQMRPQQQAHAPNRPPEDEEVRQSQRRVTKEIATAVERAKQRKEEEEKRYNTELKQAADKKLQELEKKMRSKSNSDKEESNTPSPGVNIPAPDWENEKDRSRTSSEGKDEKSPGIAAASENFRQMTQLDNRNTFVRDREQARDRERRAERESDQSGGQPAFSRVFQNNLPPRFQKQQTERPPPSYFRQNSGGSPQPSQSVSMYEPRWDNRNNGHYSNSGGGTKGRRNHTDSDVSDRDREEDRITKDRERREKNVTESHERDKYNKHGSRDRNNFDNGWKSGNYHESTDYNRGYNDYDNRIRQREIIDSDERRDKEKDNWDKNEQNTEKKFTNLRNSTHEDTFDEKREKDNMSERRSEREQMRPESRDRPQRPDSRDSRTSRESRNSRDSIRDDKYIQDIVNDRELSWADSSIEPEFKQEKPRKKDYRDENRRDNHYHQRHIPGPITREMLEAADRSEPQRLVPLIKSDKKPELKISDAQKGSSETKTSSDSVSREQAWQRHLSPAPNTTTIAKVVSGDAESWADSVDDPTLALQSPLEKPTTNEDFATGRENSESVEPSQSDQTGELVTIRNDQEEINMSLKTDSHREKNGNRSRGGQQDPRLSQRQGFSKFSGFRSAWSPRTNEGRGRGGRGSRGPTRSNQDYRHSESEISGDEISASTESGKEERDKKQDKEKSVLRSPKQGPRKSEKENKNRDTRRNEVEKVYGSNEGRRYDRRSNYDSKIGSGKEGFAPRGEPSRRGRGSFMRVRESSSNVGKRIDGYGPPSTKSPFTSQHSISEEKKGDNDSQGLTELKEEGTKAGDISIDDQNKHGSIAHDMVSKYIGTHPNSKKGSSVSPRLQFDRRERTSKSKDDRRDPRPVNRSDATEEAWETTSETSEQEDRGHDDVRNYEQRPRPYASNRHSRGANSKRTFNTKMGPGEKRSSGPYDRDSRSNQQSYVNGRVSASSNKINPNLTCGIKEPPVINRTDDIKFADSNQVPDNKKQNRSEKDKVNNLDHIDLNNFASVVIVDNHPEVTMEEEHSVFAADNGFQEVRSKKNVKEANRQLKEEIPIKSARGPKEQRNKQVASTKSAGAQSPGPVGGLSPSPASSVSQNDLPSQTVLKPAFERSRSSNKLPPRLARQREHNRLQKQQQQQHEVSELNKVNQAIGLFPLKDVSSNPAPPPSGNAWDKPIIAALKTNPPLLLNAGSMQLTSINNTLDSCGTEINEHPQSGASSQRSSPNTEKTLNKAIDKTVLDGTSPPRQTIIFENTNFKSPSELAMKAKYNNHLKNQRLDKGRERKIDEDPHAVGIGFKPPGTDKDNRTEPIQMNISFNKNEDSADMKLDFSFDSELSPLTDDKSNKTMVMPRSINIVQTSAAELNFKIASVKKVWENEPSVLEQVDDAIAVSTSSSFTPSFGNVEDTGSYVKAGVTSVDSTGVVQVDGSAMVSDEIVYKYVTFSSGPQIPNNASSYVPGGPNMMKADPNSASSNVCKVKPQPHAVIQPGALGEHVHQSPLSPSPGAFNSTNAQPSGPINYQTAAASFSNLSVPSPPAMLFNSSQPIQTQGEMYQAFQISSQVVGSQGRSQFSQFPPYGISQGLSQTSTYSQQNLFPYPSAPPPSGGPADLFPTPISQYRMQPPPAYGTSQQLSSNPNLLMSSNSNSLVSANLKASNAPIGAIGSKTGYPPSGQPPLIIQYDPSQMLNVNQSFALSNSQLVTPRPGNVPTIQASSSFYSPSTGSQSGFYPPGNSTLQPAQPSQTIQTGPFGMQAYTTQSAAATSVGMQSFGSQFLSNPLQMAQQFRTTAPSYHKSSGTVPLVSDPSKSPQQDILNSVFSSGIFLIFINVQKKECKVVDTVLMVRFLCCINHLYVI
uniref:BAT2 N-terminal domain-containing protein n=1 Tax=Clastoptera arizonana TaxID=38151 RepID=A0A1B6C1D3_9HEMI